MPVEHSADEAYAFLRSHTRGDLQFDDHVRPLPYVMSPDGRLVASVMAAMLQTVDTVLFVPDIAHEAMEIQVTLSALDPQSPDGALVDRWRIYHGDPLDTYWAFMDIDAVRYRTQVIDGDGLIRPNPLADAEPRVCREINKSRRDGLRRACRHVLGTDVEHPTLVGVDPLGLDVRRRFDVVRVPAKEPMETAQDVDRFLQELMREADA
jgi:hypothetical protein